MEQWEQQEVISAANKSNPNGHAEHSDLSS